MAAFFLDLLDDFLKDTFLHRVFKKFHYGKTQWEELYGVAKEMLPLMRKEAFWERRKSCCIHKCQEHTHVKYEDVVMSLGNGLDHLQESYNKKGLLSEIYMLQNLASELLMLGYPSYNQYIENNLDWHVANYHFLGSEKEFPLEMLPKLLKGLTPKMTCNEAFCILPKKSVAFVAQLTQDKEIHCEGICAGCQSKNCQNYVTKDFQHRKDGKIPLHYGYHRIFKKSMKKDGSPPLSGTP